ncbi:MAG: DinB family protein [Acidobacteria bacterium]|nr:DinB family protein [Acidobacteriota bacterium]
MRLKPLLAAFILLCSPASVFAQTQAPAQAKTPGDALVFSLRIVEHDLVSAAGAMPADKYDFAPTNGEFKGVRTFAQEIKHVAAANYMFASILAGEKPPRETGGENGPDTLKSKAEIMKFLNDSFAYLDNGLASVSDKNELDQLNSPFGVKVSRLSLASFAVAHPFDHYGQMVEYLRMNGIVPPSSRPQAK